MIKKERTITSIPNKFSNKFIPFALPISDREQLSLSIQLSLPNWNKSKLSSLPSDNRQDHHDAWHEPGEKKPYIASGRRMAYENSRDSESR